MLIDQSKWRGCLLTSTNGKQMHAESMICKIPEIMQMQSQWKQNHVTVQVQGFHNPTKETWPELMTYKGNNIYVIMQE